MRLLMRGLSVVLFSYLFISCQDKVINNNYEDVYIYDLGVNIDTCLYEFISAHTDCFDPEYRANAHTGYEAFFGIKLTVKLDDPSRKDAIERLVMTSGKYGYEFNKQELEETYKDSAGGYVLDNIFMGTISNRDWQFKLYGASNKASSAYEQTIPLSYAIYPINCVNNWLNKSALEIVFYHGAADSSSNISIETHFLNSNKEEISTVYSTPATYTWQIDNVPGDAVYFYFVLKDEFLETRRTYYSDFNLISDRVPENVSVNTNIDSPEVFFYLEEINKILIYSRNYQLTLLDASKGEIIWQKDQYSEPVSAVYWKDKDRILCSTGKFTSSNIEMMNPLDGSFETFLNLSSNVGNILATSNYIIFVTGGGFSFYDIPAEKLLPKNYYLSGTHGSAYNSLTKSLYMRTWQSIRSIVIDITDNGPSLKTKAVREEPILYEQFDYFNISPDKSRLYDGEGHIYRCSSDSAADLVFEADITPFLSGTFISGGYFAALTPAYSNNGEEYPASIHIYDNNNQLTGENKNIIDDPKLIINDGKYLYIYAAWNSKLAVQKISISGIINSSGRETAGIKKIYYPAKF